jgi:nitroreductase
MDFEELVRRRRSVRRFTPEPVDEASIIKALECARLAPSARNLQCWHYVVVTRKDLISEVARAGGRLNAWLKDAPAIVVGCADPRRSTQSNGIDYYAVDLAISMEHFVLAATELGLGTCWIASFDEDIVKQALSMPPGIRVVALTPLGRPAEREGVGAAVRRTVAGSAKRKELDEFVHRERW